jgi:hypothetical protein
MQADSDQLSDRGPIVLQRIFREQLGNHGRVDVGSDTRNYSALAGRQRTQLNYGLVGRKKGFRRHAQTP